jgi:hypothetical protein
MVLLLVLHLRMKIQRLRSRKAAMPMFFSSGIDEYVESFSTRMQFWTWHSRVECQQSLTRQLPHWSAAGPQHVR